MAGYIGICPLVLLKVLTLIRLCWKHTFWIGFIHLNSDPYGADVATELTAIDFFKLFFSVQRKQDFQSSVH